MKNYLKTAASLALWLGALLVSTSVQAGQTIAEWNFQEPSNATLNTTVNSGVGVGGAGTSWSVAIPGAATTGAGLLAIQNDGKGGSGSRNG